MNSFQVIIRITGYSCSPYILNSTRVILGNVNRYILKWRTDSELIYCMWQRYVFHLSIHFLSHLSCSGSQGTWYYPSIHWARSMVNPDESPVYHQARKNIDKHIHTFLSSVAPPNDPPCLLNWESWRWVSPCSHLPLPHQDRHLK